MGSLWGWLKGFEGCGKLSLGTESLVSDGGAMCEGLQVCEKLCLVVVFCREKFSLVVILAGEAAFEKC